MKNILLLLGLGLLLCSCDKNKGMMRADAKIAITGVDHFTRATSTEATPGGILGSGMTDSVAFCAKYIIGFFATSPNTHHLWLSTSFGMSEENYNARRDLVNNKLLYEGGHVINSMGTLGAFIVDSQDVCFGVLLDKNKNVILPIKDDSDPEWGWEGYDTVAYIPNAVLSKVRTEVVAAFEREDYATCYRIFDESFVFVPTTGAKWRAMKAAGIE